MSKSSKRTILKVILLGDAGVGKTSLINQYSERKFSQFYKTTIGADFIAKPIETDNSSFILQIWDTAGSERYGMLGASFYRGADCCVIVYDITNLKSFDNVQTWKKFFSDSCVEWNANNFPYLIIGNKSDLEGERQVTQEMAKQWCVQNNVDSFFECSAKEAKNVDMAFKEIVNKVKIDQEEDILFKPIKLYELHAEEKQNNCC